MTTVWMQAFSDITAVGSGIVVWAGYILLGVIARRYTVVFNKSTFHTMLILSPSGILLYSVLLILKNSVFVKDASAGVFLQYAAYICFFVSALLCLIAVMKFISLLSELQSYGGGEK